MTLLARFDHPESDRSCHRSHSRFRFRSEELLITSTAPPRTKQYFLLGRLIAYHKLFLYFLISMCMHIESRLRQIRRHHP